MASGTARYKYQTNKGNFFYARTDDSPDLKTIRGDEPTGATTEGITFKVSKASREVGCNPRFVTLVLDTPTTTVDCLINPKTVKKFVVVLKNDHKLPAIGSPITVNGRKFLVGSITEEKMK